MDRIGSRFAMLGTVRYPPWRHRALVALIVFPFLLGGVLALALGPVEGLAGFGTAFSVPAFFRHDLRPGPRLSTTLVTASENSTMLAVPVSELRGLDHEAIIEDQQRSSAESAPEIPEERPTSSSIFGYDFQDHSVRSLTAPTRRDVVEFMAEVRDYGPVLNGWLKRYESVRLEGSRRIRLVFRIENNGEAPAQNVRLRVRCPAGFRRALQPTPIQEAPTRPRFRTRLDFDLAKPISSKALMKLGRRLTADPSRDRFQSSPMKLVNWS